VRVVTELAWHGLFIRHLLRRPERAELDSFTPEWTVINCPASRPIRPATAAAPKP
jgi:phosphoenolpyruvate carboxykinase (ATP)